MRRQALLSLRSQNYSLSTLNLALNDDFYYQFHLIGPCPNLSSLRIATDVADERPANDRIVLEAKVWLRSCKSLRKLDIGITKYFAVFLTDFLLDDIPLRTLNLRPLATGCDKTFYQALAAKASLKELRLEFIGDQYTDLIDQDFLEAVLRMTSLESLDIDSEALKEEFVIAAAKRMSQLRLFRVFSATLTDAIWPSMNKLQKLKTLEVWSPHHFSSSGITSYISRLGPGNRGLHVKIVPPSSGITKDDVAEFETELKAKVDGSLDYNFLKSPA